MKWCKLYYLRSFFSFSFCASLSALNTLECLAGSDCFVRTKARLYDREQSQQRSFPSNFFLSSLSKAHFCLHCSHVWKKSKNDFTYLVPLGYFKGVILYEYIIWWQRATPIYLTYLRSTISSVTIVTSMVFSAYKGCNYATKLAAGRFTIFLHVHFTLFTDTRSATFAENKRRSIKKLTLIVMRGNIIYNYLVIFK